MQTSGPRSLGRKRPWEGLPAIGARAMTCNSVSMRVVEACIGAVDSRVVWMITTARQTMTGGGGALLDSHSHSRMI